MKPSPAVSVSLSGGGYRAAAFGAGALLALSDSSLRSHVVSVSSVSGGSIASAATIGGFDQPDDDPDPMYTRVRWLASELQTKVIFTEELLNTGRFLLLGPVLLLALLFLVTFPEWDFLEGSLIGQLGVGMFFLGAPLYVLVSAVPDSLYGVQAAIERLTARPIGTTASPAGPTLASAGRRESVRRVYCATDLGAGSHVYLSAEQVIAPGLGRTLPNLLLADVVAASAGFPGFRPLVFDRRELSGGASDASSEPQSHGVAGRFALGLAGVVGLLVAAVAYVARVAGTLSGWRGLAVAVAAIAAGVGIAVFCARRLQVREKVALVDGGVYDNLGAAFSVLTADDRYDSLVDELRLADGDLLMVVDASKPFKELDAANATGLAALVPLRIRAMQRSVFALIGNANAIARKRTISWLLAGEGRYKGAIVSITEPVDADDEQWRERARANQATKTTLDALDPATVRNLVEHAYRLTAQSIRALGYAIERERPAGAFDALADERIRAENRQRRREPVGRYGRRADRVRRATLALYLSITLPIVVLGLVSAVSSVVDAYQN